MRDLTGLRQQFVKSRERVRTLAKERQGETTSRQSAKGWVPVSWTALCTEAAHYYTELIADIDAGTYVCRYHGVGYTTGRNHE